MDIPVTNDNASAIGTSTGIGLGVMKMLEDRDAFSDIPNRCSLVTSQEESS